jgi:hypothetical protein
MPKIKFKNEWDKLKPDRFKVNNEFTTFRAYKPWLYKYYVTNYNEIWDIEYNGKIIGKAEILLLDTRWSNELTDEEIKKDTFMSWTREDFEKFLKKTYGWELIFGPWIIFKIKEVIK